jgi:hypothetical protein
MLNVSFKRLCRRAALTGGCCAALSGLAAAQVVTTHFQNGANDYSGTFDHQISENVGEEIDLNTVASYFMDGLNSAGSSPDRQILIRFDDIIGDGPGQIPSGATILGAELIVTTSVRGNAQTSGPWGVSGLLQPFDSTTSYFVDFSTTTDMGSRGAWWMDGSATRPVGGYGFQTPGGPDSANVIPLVQSWASGADNNGMVIQAGLSDALGVEANTADGWAIRTTGYPLVDTRPKLAVSYTTAPVEMNTFQDGADGYAGTTMAIVRSGLNALTEDTTDVDRPEITEDASTLDQTFLDGVHYTDLAGTTDSADDLALLKFENVFGTAAGQAPPDVPVAKAWLVVTTGDLSTAAHTSGPFAAFTMLRPWDVSSLHSSFGEVNGLQVSDGDISPALDSLDGFIRGAEVWFNVTDYLEGVRTGAADYGIAVQANGTADGWQIHTTGSTTPDARPRLVVYSAELGSE